MPAAAPNQPTISEGGTFRDDLRFAGDYREQVAFRLLGEYLDDARGPAEISRPKAYAALLGDSNEFAVRYRVTPRSSIKGGAIFLDPNGPLRTRCIVVRLHKDRLSFGDAPMTIGRQKIDPETCGDGLAFEPFPELERMADKSRQCSAQGEKDCVLYTNIPRAAAKHGR